jgi:Arc/MetJ family transcription regulator
MRINVRVDEKLVSDVLAETGIKSKQEAVEQSLKLLLRLTRQKRIKELRGKLKLS